MSSLPEAPEKRAAVKSMFDRIAPRYDTLNRMLTLGLDQHWRRKSLDAAGVKAGDVVLDIACGTGDLSEQCAARGARVIGTDFAREMLRGASRRGIAADFVQGDAERLPIPDSSIDVVTCGFALRNFGSLDTAFSEIGRVLRPGGRISLLDVDRPGSRLVAAVHSFHFDRIVPFVGGLMSDRQAYRYLPESTVYLPEANEMRAMLEKHGLVEVEQRRFLFGTAQLWLGRKGDA